MTSSHPPRGPQVRDLTVDLLVVGSGTGMAAALAGHELGLDVLVVEKTALVGGSTARSGGAFWIPANPALLADGSGDTAEQARVYLDAIVDGDAPAERRESYVSDGPATVAMLERTTPMTFFWAKGYSDYHPENPGGAAVGRTCEAKPFDARELGDERGRLRGGVLDAPVPMPVTGADYKWMNLMLRKPAKAMPRIVKRVAQGVGGLAIGREYVAGGQALAAGMFAGLIRAGVPVWTRTALVELTTDGDRVTGAVVEQDGLRATVTVRGGVVLAAGGFDHDMTMRRTYQSESLVDDLSLGAEGNTGDAIKLGADLGADLTLMDQTWWFPAVHPMGDEPPQVLLAERSLPGSFMVDQTGRRFVNEAEDYMTFGQDVLALEKKGEPVTDMWLVFDQTYRNRYVFAGTVFPRVPIPQRWYDTGIAVKAPSPGALAEQMGVPVAAFAETARTFNEYARAGIDPDFHRGDSAYDRYYGDPTVLPNANLRPLEGTLYAVRVVLSDLGTCGGLSADGRARVLRRDGSVIEGLYAIGNTAGNAFGKVYPGAGATIGQGLVFAHVAAEQIAASIRN